MKVCSTSPYFFNAGLLSSGPLIDMVATAYAKLIAESEDGGKSFDVVFGPAYKGIPFAATTSVALYRDYGIDVGYAYDRKEEKDHGEGGRMVGAEVKGKRVLILDDVMTAGTAIRKSIELIEKEGGLISGIVMLLDREEVTVTGANTVQDIENHFNGKISIKSLIKMRDLIAWLQENNKSDLLDIMLDYKSQFGLK